LAFALKRNPQGGRPFQRLSLVGGQLLQTNTKMNALKSVEGLPLN